MKGILADVNVQGQVQTLLLLLESETWRDLWLPLNLALYTLPELGLPCDVADAVIWDVCQKRELILITGNRNKEGPDSLEATLEQRNTSSSLPVLTLADPQQVLHSREYAHRVIERLLEYLLEIENVRGTGRLYLP
jgi:hypothetical protein